MGGRRKRLLPRRLAPFSAIMSATRIEPGDDGPFDMPAMHIFKFRGGELRRLEAVGVVEPQVSRPGWA